MKMTSIIRMFGFIGILLFALCLKEVYIGSNNLYGQSQDQIGEIHTDVYEENSSLFTQDKTWRGADGAASIDLGKGIK